MNKNIFYFYSLSEFIEGKKVCFIELEMVYLNIYIPLLIVYIRVKQMFATNGL